VNAKGIKAEGVTFENMRFLNRIPTVEQGQMNEKQSITFRTTVATPVVSFAGANLQNTRWKGTELTKVNGKGETVPAVSFANADISSADFSEALIDATPVKQLFERVLNEGMDAHKAVNRLRLYFKGAKHSLFKAPNVTGAFMDSKTVDSLKEKIFDTKG
jgi:uncharacterized protein YjbI with pentapeptide repeats